MNIKCLLAVVNLVLGRSVTDVYAVGNFTESYPFQEYVKKGNEAVLECKNGSAFMMWHKKINEEWKLIVNKDAFNDNFSTKYNVSRIPGTNLFYRLHVLNAQLEDELIYSCRVGINNDYYLQLFLFVPPSGISFDGSTNGKLEGTEGKDLLIRCVANGGKPPPEVSILDSSMSIGILNGTQEVSYTIPEISRNYHQMSIDCKAKSNASVSLIEIKVQICLNLKPLTPIFEKDPISTEETVPLRVSCISYGSRPAANFTWTIGGNDVTSSSTTSSVTAPKDTKTVTSTLTYSVKRSHNNKSITCEAFNTVGSTDAVKTLDVKYAPDITVISPTYDQNDVNITVTCNPSGNPNRYVYHKWQHKSKYGEIIREWMVVNKTLKLPESSILSRYKDTGEYVCTASNGIKGIDNNFQQKGSKYVTIEAQPVFTSDTIDRVKQFGEIDKAVDIYVNVYSVPKFTSFVWTHKGTPITQNSEKYEAASFPTVVKDKINGKEVQLDGYNVTLTIHDLTGDDFTNYTVTIINRFKTVIYTVILESASVPETPGNFSRIASSSTSITVQWDPNSGGGYKQTFYIQYRVQGLLKWTNVSAGDEDINESKIRRTYKVKNLQEGKAYELRMFAENAAKKKSNFTDVLIALTDSGSGPPVAAIVGGIAGCLIAIIIALLVIVFVQKKRKENGTASTKLRASSENEEEDGLKDNILYESSQSDGLKTNALYKSAEPDFVSLKKPSTSSEYAVVQKPNAIYAEVNKMVQPKNAKEKKQKDKKGKPKKTTKEKTKAMNNNPEEEYANSAVPLRNLNDGNSTDSQGPSGDHPNAQGLEYADLTFRQIPAKNKKQVIHGIDERTIYADVDHTKKAPPPPQESEYEETNIKHGKMA